MSSRYPDDGEWLEADGLGGFASGTVSGVRTRRYHALLLAATTPPTGRVCLVNGFDAEVTTGARAEALSTQRYAPDVIHPDGVRRIVDFTPEPWPHWTFRLDDGTVIEHEIVARHGAPVVLVAWRLVARGKGADARPVACGPVTLRVRPFLSGRDYHALHHENPSCDFRVAVAGERVRWQPYGGIPAVVATSNGRYAHAPDWYRRFLYTEEQARGLDAVEDLAAPGTFDFDLAREEAVILFAVEGAEAPADVGRHAVPRACELRAIERRRRAAFATRAERAADAYVVARGDGRKTIVAGYPWFTDWGRDTFIAMRGLCLATGRLDDARAILLAWGDAVSDGMVPNRFPDHGDVPEYNAVDAALWYVIAADEYVQARARAGELVPDDEQFRLRAAIDAILTGYAAGTRYAIRCDGVDGLLAAGEPGVQLTWMDAKVGDWVVTPRIGKPVEVQALWLNALHVGSRFSERWRDLGVRGQASFRERFWHEAAGGLYDVVDCDHRAGAVDAAFRPNQIFAVGGLPLMLLEGERARRLVETVAARLWTPVGLRSLAPGEPGYAGRYAGGVRERDGAYHQGTVWPWLLGAFVEAWVRVRGATPEAKRTARERFLVPLWRHLDDAGLGHVAEIADGDAPHTPRGCPFQAWSVGEALRLDRVVLA
jgi:predicted glycogen debranching enzyme